MTETLKNLFRIRTALNANRFIYYFKRIWLVGKLLPDSVYADGSLKTVLTVLVGVCVEIWHFMTKGLYVGLAVLLPALLAGETTGGESGFSFSMALSGGASLANFVHILFFLSFLLGPIEESAIFMMTPEKLTCIKFMRMDARQYARAMLLFRYVPFFAYFLPFLFAAVLLLGGTVWQALLIWLLMIAFRLFGEELQLRLYERTGMVLSRKTGLIIALCAVGGAAAYLPALIGAGVPTMGLLLSVPSVILFLLLGGLCVFDLFWKFPRYHSVLVRSMDENFLFANLMKQANGASFKDVALRETDLDRDSVKLGKYQNRTGYSYLNAIFFDRHRRQITRPVWIVLGVIALAFAGGVVLQIQMPELARKCFSAGRIGRLLPLFVFLMYLVSMISERACRAMFYNCDISLLRYGFYRNRSVILKNFKIRLLRLCRYSLLVGVALCAAIGGLTALSGGSWPLPEQGMFLAGILLLSVLFTVHHLFMYYVFQPYTTELNIKNPFFKIINAAVYLACFACLQIQTATRIFSVGVLVVTVVYIGLALLLVFRFAQKTFRVK